MPGGAAGAYRLGLAGVAQHPYRPARTSVHRGQDSVDLVGGGLGDLVEDDDRPGRKRPVAQVDAQPGDRFGLQAGAAQLGHRLSRGGHRHHRSAVVGGRTGCGVQHRRLPITSRRQDGPQAATGTGEHRHRGRLVLTESRLQSQGGIHRRGVDDRCGACGQCVHQGDRAVLERPVGGRRPLSRPAAAHLVGGQAHCQPGLDEPVGHDGDLLDGEPAAGDGADVLDHICLREPSRPGTQPGLRIDQGRRDLVPTWRLQPWTVAADRPVQVGPCGQADLLCFALPAPGQ